MDMINKKCSCGKGHYIEMFISDDWRGVLHCNACKKEIKRHISLSEHRDMQIEKVIK